MRWLVIVALFISVQASAQCKTYMIGIHHDTLNCTDYSDLKQGKWVVHVASMHGEPGYEEEGVFKDNKKEGRWRRYTLQGDVLAIENYKYGYKNGLSDYYDMWGLEHEESWKATNPDNPYDTVKVYDLDDPDKFTYKMMKAEAFTQQHGTWTFYDSQRGTIVKTQEWELGVQIDPVTRRPVKGSTTKNPVAVSGKVPALIARHDSTGVVSTKPPEVKAYEKKNAGKKRIKVRDGETGN